MEFGVHVHDSDDWSRMSYSGPGTPMPPVDDPVIAYDRLFSGLNTDPAGQKLLASQRKLVLDSVLADANKLKQKLGAADKQKLEQHLDSIGQIEAHLSNTVTIGGACKDPGQPTDPSQGVYDNDSYGQIGKLQMDLLVMALTCDITRVASMQWTRSVGMVVFDWVDGCTDGHHTISHAADTDTVSQNQLIGINNWYAQQIKYLIESMKAIPEGNGTLFDNTAILWVNELAIGNIHSHNDMRYLIAGGCGGKIKTGRHLQFNGDPHNNLLLSMCQAMGAQQDHVRQPGLLHRARSPAWSAEASLRSIVLGSIAGSGGVRCRGPRRRARSCGRRRPGSSPSRGRFGSASGRATRSSRLGGRSPGRCRSSSGR